MIVLHNREITLKALCRQSRGKKCVRQGLCKSIYKIDKDGFVVENDEPGGFYICPHLELVRE